MTLTRLPAPGRVWTPTSQQTAEPDTVFLLDPDGDVAAGMVVDDPLTQGTFDLYVDNAAHPPNVVAGRFLKGINPASTTTWWWFPCHGILGTDEFTIELQAKCSADWSAADPGSLIEVGDHNDSQYVEIGLDSSHRLVAKASQTQTSPGGGGGTASTAALTAGAMPADTWFSLAVTLRAGTLRLYRDGTQIASVAGVVSPFVWDGANRSAGVSICSGPETCNPQFTVSDVRISRKARTPGQGPVLSGADRSQVVVGATATGATIQKLSGALHAFTDSVGVSTVASAYQTAHGGIRCIRTDKFLTVTPIKAGGTNATHPSAGQSGSYSYDWQVVDRSMDYIVNTLGCEPLISLDAVPQLLGGSVAPFSGTQLTSGYAYESQYPPGPPNDNAAFATMCADLAYHLVTELGYTVPYMSLWNEPDGGQFWETFATNPGFVDDYCSLYQEVAPAVRAVEPSIKLGGPELGAWHSSTIQDPFVSQLITFCATNSLPLDFIAWHWYTGNLSEPQQVRRFVEQTALTAGITQPELLCGEGCWQLAWFGVFGGLVPWKVAYFRNDFHAAFYAAAMIQMQAAGVKRAIFNSGDGNARPLVDGDTGIPYANYNVARLWTMTEGNDVLASVQTSDPGVFAVASKNAGTGKVYVFLASIHYRKTQNYPVLVDVSAVAADGDAVVTYVVDDAHSNQLDAGTVNADLQTGETTIGTGGRNVVSSGKVGISLRPRAAALLVIG